jgi:amino acid adenylation domain-containing protein
MTASLTKTGSYKELEPAESTVLQLFRDAMLRSRDSVAILDGKTSLSYTKLWNLAATIRARLAAQGVVPGDLVGIASPRSIHTVAAILGVIMAGGCYVPVDFEGLPEQVIEQLVIRNGIHHWIADREALKSHKSKTFLGHSALQLDDISCPEDQAPIDIPAVPINAESPLYVMFTSGSTGLPKGVVVPHRAVVRLVTGQNFLQFGPEHTFLLHSPLSFDASTLELWGGLLHGGRVAIAPCGRLGLAEYTELVAGLNVTTLWLTAAIFHLAAEHAPEMFLPLRQLIFGGDVIAPRPVERLRTLYPALHMVNGYGPTENTTFTCCFVVPANYRAEGSLPIGFPIAHTTVQILDENLKAVDAGEPGELVTGGAGVALGYLGDEGATAERFIADSSEGATQYRTGDRVRLRQDGAIEFLGRMDAQVKIAGNRVEVGAVEQAILSSPLVADAAVVVLHAAEREKQLVACVSVTGAAEKAEAQLRLWLGERLSRASVPQQWIFLDRLPMNANGKLDRTALRVRCEALFIAQTATVAAPKQGGGTLDRTAIEVYLQQLWMSLLNRASVGLDENFFDLGGTSLLLIEMHARLKAQFARTPSVVEIFSLPTPRALAERLDAAGELPRVSNAAEDRGQRQRAAMLARRPAANAARIANVDVAVAAGKEGSR